MTSSGSDPSLAVPVYTASAVAARLGVAVETLRTWDRRYGLGPGTRGPGGRRRYGEQDLARLLVMRRLVTSGMPTAEAARRAAGGADGLPPVGVKLPLRPRAGGGRVLAIPRGSTLQHGLARAATALDMDEVTRLLEQVVAEAGVARAWDTLLRPVLTAVGERWARSGEGIDVEHLLSQAAMDVFRRAADRAAATHERSDGRTDASTPVLLASVDGEAHVLPLYVMAALLTEAHVRVRLLGASMPLAALSDALGRLRPRGVLLWAQLVSPLNREFAEALGEVRSGAQMVVGGPAWEAEQLPERVRLAGSLDDAMRMLLPS